jgi:putative hydroxymethylpyrimidine transport system permease protein
MGTRFLTSRALHGPARALVIGLGLLAAWQALVMATELPPYILPDPLRVMAALFTHAASIGRHAALTLAEIVLGLGLGIGLGAASALLIVAFRPARRWLLPLLVVSQAVPVFALAPLLVLWLGYGLASKVAMAAVIIYFPVTAAFSDGLRRADPGWLDLALSMDAGRLATLRHIRAPAALPALASGIRVATAVAPIGAVVGEWVGASAGLGYLMLHANARMQIDLMFAALLTLGAIAVALYFAVDRVLKRVMPWQPESSPAED